MAKGIFVTGFTVEQVRAIQARATAMLLEGKTLMSWGDSGSSVTKQFAMPVAEVLDECGYALRILDPATFAPARRVASSSVSGHLQK